jgi:hypothetical protein
MSVELINASAVVVADGAVSPRRIAAVWRMGKGVRVPGFRMFTAGGAAVAHGDAGGSRRPPCRCSASHPERHHWDFAGCRLRLRDRIAPRWRRLRLRAGQHSEHAASWARRHRRKHVNQAHERVQEKKASGEFLDLWRRLR